jgi:hypothetical protein
MMVQWCVRGLSLDDNDAAKSIIDAQQGLWCQWWRNATSMPPFDQIPAKLTADNLDRHVNHFTAIDPATSRPFNEATPFISLSAGTIERNTVLATNVARRARYWALYFGSECNTKDVAYLFLCWLVVAPRKSVAVKAVAEEVRDLHVYRSYSHFQQEGEITAKLEVPANQIKHCEKWEKISGSFRRTWTYDNPIFTSPQTLSNIWAARSNHATSCGRSRPPRPGPE